MPRINALAPESATGHTQELFTSIKSKLGVVPNLMKTMGHSPALLEAYLQFSGKLGGGVLPAKVREQISLAVGQKNDCDYCVSAHSAIGKKLGLSTEQILDSRHGISQDPKTAAILTFSQRIIEKQGHVSDADVQDVRTAGVTDAEIVEIVGNVALNIFTNYFNHISDTEIDFPRAEALKA
ncbi:carboxymuconolactone decarboxylase family protein [Telmatocola sphagniphila]|uniref:Carboxymuconolactone decarboxylase family protein n=1 Tax=Telmatocola sphagniphila TaxID=1123043 RepID=A0A8E6B1J9_9BACT|nr:carboxymuconolactone decarboxylase family protein [Telmatocola sphagniphila]QVL30072.1 carboxymuconolactone decarboxylase family protein [Telmatocola sphagniphila]